MEVIRTYDDHTRRATINLSFSSQPIYIEAMHMPMTNMFAPAKIFIPGDAIRCAADALEFGRAMIRASLLVEEIDGMSIEAPRVNVGV